MSGIVISGDTRGGVGGPQRRPAAAAPAAGAYKAAVGGVLAKLQAAWNRAEEATAHNQRITVSVAFNFGGRWDVVQACRRAMVSGMAPQEMTEEAFARLLVLSDAPDPDLFIRTGGEMRLSNFLLWQAAYAELYFTDCLWPDFGAAEIDKALASFASRDRRFGGAESWASGPDASG